MGSCVEMVAGSESLRRAEIAKSDFIIINIPPTTKANATSQYLARLIRPSKLNRNDLKPMGSSGMPTTARGLALGSRRALLPFDAGITAMGRHGAAQIPAHFDVPNPLWHHSDRPAPAGRARTG